MEVGCSSQCHIDASHSLQPLLNGVRLARYEVNAVMGCSSQCDGSVAWIVTGAEPDHDVDVGVGNDRQELRPSAALRPSGLQNTGNWMGLAV